MSPKINDDKKPLKGVSSKSKAIVKPKNPAIKNSCHLCRITFPIAADLKKHTNEVHFKVRKDHS